MSDNLSNMRDNLQHPIMGPMTLQSSYRISWILEYHIENSLKYFYFSQRKVFEGGILAFELICFGSRKNRENSKLFLKILKKYWWRTYVCFLHSYQILKLFFLFLILFYFCSLPSGLPLFFLDFLLAHPHQPRPTSMASLGLLVIYTRYWNQSIVCQRKNYDSKFSMVFQFSFKCCVSFSTRFVML